MRPPLPSIKITFRRLILLTLIQTPSRLLPIRTALVRTPLTFPHSPLPAPVLGKYLLLGTLTLLTPLTPVLTLRPKPHHDCRT